jgi:hypothetical protein
MAKEILKISSDQYFALPKLSNSAIKDFRNEGPWTYYHRYVANSLDKPKESDAQRIGSALHSIINIDAFSSSSQPIAVMPEWVDLGGIQPEKLNLRKKAHREFKQEFIDRNAGKIILTQHEYEQVVGMRDSIWDNPAIRPYLDQLTADRSEVVATNTVNGIECKAMCDADFSDQGLVIDFKTTRQSLGKEFVKDCLWKYGYQYQAAHYCDVFEAERFLFVAVRNFEPYESVLFEMPADFIGQAQHINHQTIDRIKWCQQMDEWHSDGWGQVINMEDVLDND